MTKRGLFITFEGTDGAGKSTQIDLLTAALRQGGHHVVVSREPGGSPGGEAIRDLLLTGDKDRWSPMTEALLMYAARRDHLEKTILPALAQGAICIVDRFADLTTAYQGVAGGLGAEAVKALYDLAVGENGPDLTIILDAPIEEGLARADGTEKGETRFEEKGAEFQQAVRDAFREIAINNPRRCRLIDARGEIDAVAIRIRAVIGEKFPHLL